MLGCYTGRAESKPNRVAAWRRSESFTPSSFMMTSCLIVTDIIGRTWRWRGGGRRRGRGRGIQGRGRGGGRGASNAHSRHEARSRGGRRALGRGQNLRGLWRVPGGRGGCREESPEGRGRGARGRGGSLKSWTLDALMFICSVIVPPSVQLQELMLRNVVHVLTLL
ncbi:hypothetical protein FKP32DRAFT_380637 [Trametes sanguinea]|nr:hypothetical protein FKP32DRAFT_380637 [Trametes sanguinea]